MRRFMMLIMVLSLLLNGAGALADHGEADIPFEGESFHLTLMRINAREDNVWVTIDGFTKGSLIGTHIWDQKEVVKVKLVYGDEEVYLNTTIDYKDERGRSEFGTSTDKGMPDSIRLYPYDSDEYVVIWEAGDPVPAE